MQTKEQIAAGYFKFLKIAGVAIVVIAALIRLFNHKVLKLDNRMEWHYHHTETNRYNYYIGPNIQKDDIVRIYLIDDERIAIEVWRK